MLFIKRNELRCIPLDVARQQSFSVEQVLLAVGIGDSPDFVGRLTVTVLGESHPVPFVSDLGPACVFAGKGLCDTLA